MSINRLKELVGALDNVNSITSSVINDNSKSERAAMRYEAIVKIQQYLKEIADATKDYSFQVQTHINIFWLNNDMDTSDTRTKYHYLKISFHKGKVTFYEPSYGSSLDIIDFCNVPKEEIYEFTYKNHDRIMDETKIKTDFINIVNKWSDIKTAIDVGSEKAILEQIQEKKAELSNFKNSYENCMNFKCE